MDRDDVEWNWRLGRMSRQKTEHNSTLRCLFATGDLQRYCKRSVPSNSERNIQ